MKLIRNLTLLIVILIFILCAIDIMSMEVGISIILVSIIIIFAIFSVRENSQKIEGKVIIVHDHIMIQSNGVYYDYKFHRNFDCMSILENGAKVEGYFEDTHFIITKLCWLGVTRGEDEVVAIPALFLSWFVSALCPLIYYRNWR